MHVRDHAAFGDLEQIREKILEMDYYYSEMDLEMAPDPEMISFQVMPGEQTLRTIIPEKKYLKLQHSIQKSFGIDIQIYDHFYPMILSNLIQTTVLENQSELILDYHLYQMAREEGKKMRYLESLETQLDIFSKISLEAQLKSLLQLGRQPNKAKKQLKALVQDYAERNTRQMYHRTQKQLGKLRHKLLYDRNVKMAEKLAEELQETRAFVAVGAAHLFGYKGILRLLKNAGYQIRAVEAPSAMTEKIMKDKF